MEDKALGDGFVAFVNMDNAYKAFEIHNHKQLQDRSGWTWTFDNNVKKLLEAGFIIGV